ncbi:hypothetical protein [Actinokineospora sp. NPDC004072]
MTRLERRYRALLAVLPRRYRAEREEEMVASFLDSRHGNRGDDRGDSREDGRGDDREGDRESDRGDGRESDRESDRGDDRESDRGDDRGDGREGDRGDGREGDRGDDDGNGRDDGRGNERGEGREGGREGDLDAEYGWPGWAETRATLALAVRTRLTGRAREAARLAGLFGLLLGVAMAAYSVTSAVRAQPVVSLWTLVAVTSAGALVAAARGAWTEARLLAAVPALPAAVAVAVAFPPADPPWQPALAAAFFLPAAATAVFLVAAVPRRPGARWLWAGAVAAAVGALLPLAGIDPLTCAPAALLGAAAVGGSRVWTDAVALSAAVLLPHAALLAALPGTAPRPLLVGLAAAAALAALAPLRRRAAPRPAPRSGRLAR